MSAVTYSTPPVNTAPEPGGTLILHPKSVAHPKATTTAKPVVAVSRYATGAGSPRQRNLTQRFSTPAPAPTGGCKGCASKASKTGDTSAGFTRVQNGGAAPTDSRVGSPHATAIQIRPQAADAVPLVSMVDSADPVVAAGEADPSYLQPGNLPTPLQGPITKAQSFFYANNKPQWSHILITVALVVGGVALYRAMK